MIHSSTWDVGGDNFRFEIKITDIETQNSFRQNIYSYNSHYTSKEEMGGFIEIIQEKAKRKVAKKVRSSLKHSLDAMKNNYG